MSGLAITQLEFSYGQFDVFDPTVYDGGVLWTAIHNNQGFARRGSYVSFRTLLDFGTADLSVFLSSYLPKQHYDRVIAVPMHIVGGIVEIEGPEEVVVTDRKISIEVGYYRLTAGQWISGDDMNSGEPKQAIDLFFERVETPLVNSKVIVADSALAPPTVLEEFAEKPVF